MTVINDREFGPIIVRRSARAAHTKIKVDAKRRLVVSAPPYVPVLYLKSVIATSRKDIRSMLAAALPVQTVYTDGQQIGLEHSIAFIESGLVNAPAVTVSRKVIVVKLPRGTEPGSEEVQQLLRTHIVRVLKKEANAYLPERLATLAKAGAFRYERVRFSHATGRWGSCSASGTISLNIALMLLPKTLIDYVLIHELCHTVHMNHSTDFWQLVETHDVSYRSHRRQLKRFSPVV